MQDVDILAEIYKSESDSPSAELYPSHCHPWACRPVHAKPLKLENGIAPVVTQEVPRTLTRCATVGAREKMRRWRRYAKGAMSDC